MVYFKSSRSNKAPLYPHTGHDYDENTISATNGVYMSIVLAEPTLYLIGFDKHECQDQTPVLLRGSLIIKITKPTKIKSIQLKFKGISKTEWPEGIPPTKVDVFEAETFFSHIWPFFDSSDKTAEYSSGANLVKLIKDVPETHSKSLFRMRSASPAPFQQEHDSDLTLAPNRSYSKIEKPESDVQSKGYRTFQPGEYIYNFELPLPHTLPETIRTHYGTVKYFLEGCIQRYGTFKHRITGFKSVQLIRATSFNNLETTEPISIDKKWENQLKYDILIAGKLFPIGTTIPITFKLQRLDDNMRCHRIRVYLSESIEYFCKDRRVHRVESTRRYLLKELVASSGLSGTLIDPEQGVAEFEQNIYIPKTFGNNRDALHPNSTFANIKIHHWIKIVLRLSKFESKRKYFEVSIDSPISLLHSQCIQQNLELPRYSIPNIARSPSIVGSLSSTMFDQSASAMLAAPPPPPYSTNQVHQQQQRTPPPNYDQNDYTSTAEIDDVNASSSGDDEEYTADTAQRSSDELCDRLSRYSITNSIHKNELSSVPPLSTPEHEYDSESSSSSIINVDLNSPAMPPASAKHSDNNTPSSQPTPQQHPCI